MFAAHRPLWPTPWRWRRALRGQGAAWRPAAIPPPPPTCEPRSDLVRRGRRHEPEPSASATVHGRDRRAGLLPSYDWLLPEPKAPWSAAAPLPPSSPNAPPILLGAESVSIPASREGRPPGGGACPGPRSGASCPSRGDASRKGLRSLFGAASFATRRSEPKGTKTVLTPESALPANLPFIFPHIPPQFGRRPAAGFFGARNRAVWGQGLRTPAPRVGPDSLARRSHFRRRRLRGRGPRRARSPFRCPRPCCMHRRRPALPSSPSREGVSHRTFGSSALAAANRADWFRGCRRREQRPSCVRIAIRSTCWSLRVHCTPRPDDSGNARVATRESDRAGELCCGGST